MTTREIQMHYVAENYLILAHPLLSYPLEAFDRALDRYRRWESRTHCPELANMSWEQYFHQVVNARVEWNLSLKEDNL